VRRIETLLREFRQHFVLGIGHAGDQQPAARRDKIRRQSKLTSFVVRPRKTLRLFLIAL
jgi:hypothetical protein